MKLENTIRISVFLSMILFLILERGDIISKLKWSSLLNYFRWNRKLSDIAIYEPVARPVFTHTKLVDMREGASVRVTGVLPATSEKFLISLSSNNDPRDIQLILSPNLSYKYIVRSSKIKGVWKTEEIGSWQPFNLKRNSNFCIQILTTEACYMIAVNGYHFAEYAHRLPYELVNCVDVKGDVEQVHATFSYVQTYPERFNEMMVIRSVEAINSVNGDCTMSSERIQLSVPYYGRLSRGTLTHGRYLKIEGYVKMLPIFFFIKLQKGQDVWPQPLVAFHFNPRYSEKHSGLKSVIVCSAWRDRLLEEKRFMLHRELMPMNSFSLFIVCGEHAYDVYLNGERIVQFTYQVDPSIADTVYIHGDIKLRSVLVGQT